MPRKARKPEYPAPAASERERISEEPSRDLAFEKNFDDDNRGRVGDPRTPRRLREEFPPTRVRQAGKTGGETPDTDVTADDMTQDTLLDEDPSHTPSAGARRSPRDTVLRDSGAAEIGAGGGLDEAELASRKPVGADESERLRRLAERHARDPQAVEPHEAAEARARRRQAGTTQAPGTHKRS